MFAILGWKQIGLNSFENNCGMIFFFILSFFVGYILSFGLVRLRTIRLSLSARAGTHIECRCSPACGEDVTITDVIIKTRDWKCVSGCEWRHARMRWAKDFGWFLKKSSELRFGPRRVPLFAAGCARVGWVSELRANAGRTVSIVKIVCECLSLSLLVPKA